MKRVLYQDAEMMEVAALPEAPVTLVSRLPDNLSSDLPEINESTWRQQRGVSWSQLIIVRDDFEGDYLAVLDNSYSISGFFTRKVSGILTNWSADQLAIHAYEKEDDNFVLSYSCWPVEKVTLKVGEQTFSLHGENNIFPIHDELANVLASQPEETPMLTYRGLDGAIVTREIGRGTVEAWGMIYGAVEGE